jgi:hypothetical protein
MQPIEQQNDEDEADSQWEYEYHETETEVQYPSFGHLYLPDLAPYRMSLLR